ncbi:MAG: DUF3365 domain-containing protein [Granulosicoccus sp.]|nr:DUF3365 domain-containing protein [Granulosicoccus sp.]
MVNIHAASIGRLSVLLLFLWFLPPTVSLANSPASDAELDIALSLADVLRASRTEIASQQDHINNPDIGDKQLDGSVILANILSRLKADNKVDPSAIDPDTLKGRLLSAQLQAIREITDENQPLLNKKGIGFKGFVPAVFAQLINERFSTIVGDEAELKVTAPMQLVRNRKARPDQWERSVLETRFGSSEWTRGELYSEETEDSRGKAFRVMVPEYYGEACLACHGSPKGDIDITGHPKEGGELGDLGGSISITLYR